jgi:hypothetical protein
MNLIFRTCILAMVLVFMLTSCGKDRFNPSPPFSAVPSAAPGKVLDSASIDKSIPPGSVPRWIEYEKALAGAMLAGETYPPGDSGNGFCEWVLIGHQANEVYVYALCQVAASTEGTAMSAPAVIYLGIDRNILSVALPKDGSGYGPSIKQLFPAIYQACALDGACFDGPAAMRHIQRRRQDQSIPPLIVEQGVSLP